jgi:tape measure domain-containing protein
MVDFATLQIRADSSQVRAAAADLNSLDASGRNAARGVRQAVDGLGSLGQAQRMIAGMSASLTGAQIAAQGLGRGAVNATGMINGMTASLSAAQLAAQATFNSMSAGLGAVSGHAQRTSSMIAGMSSSMSAGAIRMAAGFAAASAAARSTETAVQSITPAVSNASSGFSALSGAVAGYVGIGAAQHTVVLADSMTLLDARVKNASKSTEEFIAAQQSLVDVSLDTHSSLEANALLFVRINKSLQSMGGSLATTTALTQTLNEGLKSSGAGASEARSFVIQFSQAMSSGVVRGDEFNSMMENGSRLVDALTTALGKSKGELRTMAEEGKLTAQVVTNALLSQSKVIHDEYKQIPLTIGAALEDARTRWSLYIHDADKATGATSAVANSIKSVGENLPVIVGMTSGIAGVTAVIWGANAAMIAFNLTTRANPLVLVATLAAAGIGAVIGKIKQADADYQSFMTKANTADEQNLKIKQQIAKINAITDDSALSKNRKATATEELKILIDQRNELLQKSLAGEQGLYVNDATTKKASFKEVIDSKKKELDNSVSYIKLAAEQENAIVESQLSQLDRLYKDGQVSVKNYFDQSNALIRQQSEIAINTAKAQMALISSELKSLDTPNVTVGFSVDSSGLNGLSKALESVSQKFGVDFAKEITQAATANKLPPAVLAGLISHETGGSFNPRSENPTTHARGLGQLLRGATADMKANYDEMWDAAKNIQVTAKYLKARIDAQGGDIKRGLAAYYAGDGGLRSGGKDAIFGTQTYAPDILARAAKMGGAQVDPKDAVESQSRRNELLMKQVELQGTISALTLKEQEALSNNNEKLLDIGRAYELAARSANDTFDLGIKKLNEDREALAAVGKPLSDDAYIKAQIDLTEALWDSVAATKSETIAMENKLKIKQRLKGLETGVNEAKATLELAKQLQLSGLSGDQITKQIQLQNELNSAIKANPNLNANEVKALTNERLFAQQQLEEITKTSSKNSSDFASEVWLQSARNIQNSLSNAIERGFENGGRNALPDLADAIKRSLGSALANEISATILSSVKGMAGGGSGGGLLSSISGLFGGGSGGGLSSLLGSFGSSPFNGTGPMAAFAGKGAASSGLLGGLGSVGSMASAAMPIVGGVMGLVSMIGPLFMKKFRMEDWTRDDTKTTGSVLGDPKKASESIDNLYKLSQDLGFKNYTVLKDINTGIKGVRDGIIQAVTGSLGRGELNAPNVPSAKPGVLGLFSSKSNLTQNSIKGQGDELGRLMDGAILKLSQFTQIVTTNSGFLGIGSSNKARNTLTAMSDETNQEVTKIFTSIGSTLIASGKSLGLNVAEQVRGIKIPDLQINIKDMSGEDATKAFNAAISTIADGIAKDTFPAFLQFQKVGEGFLETIVRVAADTAILSSQLEMLGVNMSALPGDLVGFGQAMVKAGGDIKTVSNSMTEFFNKFYSATEQGAANQKFLTDTLGQLNLELPKTAQGWRELVVQQLQAGAANAETSNRLLELTDSADKFYNASGSAVKAFDDIIKSLDEAIKLRGQTAVGAASKEFLERFNAISRSVESGAMTLADAHIKINDAYALGMDKLKDVFSSVNDAFDLLGKSDLQQAVEKIDKDFRSFNDLAVEALKAGVPLKIVEDQLSRNAAVAASQLENAFADINTAFYEIGKTDLQKQAEKIKADMLAANDAVVTAFLKTDQSSAWRARAEAQFERNGAVALAAGRALFDPLVQEFIDLGKLGVEKSAGGIQTWYQNTLKSVEDIALVYGVTTQQALDGINKIRESRVNALRDELIAADKVRQKAIADKGFSISDKILELTNVGALESIQRARALADLNSSNYDDQMAAVDTLFNLTMQGYDKQLEAVNKIKDASKNILDFVNKFKLGPLSTLSPEARLAEARAQYNTQLSAARAGDADAMGKVTDSFNSYVEAQRDYTASGVPTQDVINQGLADLSSLALKSSDPAADTALNTANTVSQLKTLQDYLGNISRQQTSVLSADLNKISAQMGGVQTTAAPLAPSAGSLNSLLPGGGSILTAGGGSSVSATAVLTQFDKDIAQFGEFMRTGINRNDVNAFRSAAKFALDKGYKKQEIADYVAATYGISASDTLEFMRVQGFATGGFYPGGLAMVGEQGPELINFDKPGQVYTAPQTRSLLSGGDNGELLAEVRALKEEMKQLRETNNLLRANVNMTQAGFKQTVAQGEEQARALSNMERKQRIQEAANG